jgi:hypothetical protein
VQQHVPQRGVLLAPGGVLGPDVGQPQVVGDVAAFGQDVRERGGHALGRGRRVEQGAGAYWLCGPRVCDAADHVGEDPAVPEHRDLQAGFRPGGHQLAGRGLDLRLQVSHPP